MATMQSVPQDGSFNNVTLNPSFPNDILGTRGRLVGGGAEVLNTTSPLNAQGLVTAYLIPQERQNTMAMTPTPYSGTSSTGFTYTLVPALLGNRPPATSSEAYQLPSSKQWLAKDGGYIVFRQNGLNNPIQMYDYRQRLYFAETPVSGSVGTGGMASGFPGITGTVTNAPPPAFDNFFFDSPFHTSGLYFSGLSNATTLTVNLKLLVEVAPGPTSPFVTVATPSPEYDPLALEMYSRAMNVMPIGVPQKMNPAGEWWSGVLSTIGDIAMPALSAIGLAPVGMAVAGASKMLSKVAKSADGSLEKFRENQKKKNGGKPTKAEREIEGISDRLAKASVRKSVSKKGKKKPAKQRAVMDYEE